MNLLFKSTQQKVAHSFGKIINTPYDNIKATIIHQPKRTFKVGDQAPYSHNEAYLFPKGYRPWTINYSGNGLFLATLGLCWFSYFSYEQSYLERTERTERVEREYYRT